MQTTTQELKQYITRLFNYLTTKHGNVKREEAAENILPPRFVDGSPYSSHTRNLHLLQQ